MRRIWEKRFWTTATLTLALLCAPAAQAVRLKDVASIEGVRENQLVGYGVVIGLSGTGDGTSNEFTIRSVMAMLRRHGLTVDSSDIKPKNVASVMVTAKLPPFAKPGSRIDVLVSSVGDAKSLQGGTLLMTPLKAPNGQVHAVAQGAMALGGFGISAGGSAVQKNHLTVASIANGGIVERGANITLDDRSSINVLLDNPDFVTASRIAMTINAELNGAIAHAADSGTVTVKLPPNLKGGLVDFIAQVESVNVFPDQRARIILDERTGTVIMGEDVRISTVAVAYGGLTFQISQFNAVVQPLPFSPTSAETRTETNEQIGTQERQVKFSVLPEGVSLSEVVIGLNALGVSARDLIAIIQAIKAAGALQAEVEIR